MTPHRRNRYRKPEGTPRIYNRSIEFDSPCETRFTPTKRQSSARRPDVMVNTRRDVAHLERGWRCGRCD